MSATATITAPPSRPAAAPSAPDVDTPPTGPRTLRHGPLLTSATDVTRLGTVLGVWAHPDDEAFLSAGLMASARAAGGRVAVMTATRGEAGTPDPVAWPPERLGGLRSAELAASLAALGVTEHTFLGHTDGTCATLDDRQEAARVAAEIDRVAPDTIVTFGPDGVTGHDDHRAVHRWVTRAWHATGRQPLLLYAALPEGFHDEWRDVHDAMSVFYPGFPLEVPATDLAVDLPLSGALLDRKMVAMRAQASQIGPLIDAVGEERFRAWWARECFVAAT